MRWGRASRVRVCRFELCRRRRSCRCPASPLWTALLQAQRSPGQPTLAHGSACTWGAGCSAPGHRQQQSNCAAALVTAWLVRYGQHVRCLRIDCYADSATRQIINCELAGCLSACAATAAAGSLQQLSLALYGSSGTLCVASWCAALRQLRSLDLDASYSGQLRIGSSLAGLTALTQLTLHGQRVSVDAAAQLPPAVERLQLQDSASPALPLQVGCVVCAYPRSFCPQRVFGAGVCSGQTMACNNPHDCPAPRPSAAAVGPHPHHPAGEQRGAEEGHPEVHCFAKRICTHRDAAWCRQQIVSNHWLFISHLPDFVAHRCCTTCRAPLVALRC